MQCWPETVFSGIDTGRTRQTLTPATMTEANLSSKRSTSMESAAPTVVDHRSCTRSIR